MYSLKQYTCEVHIQFHKYTIRKKGDSFIKNRRQADENEIRNSCALSTQ